MDFDVFGSQFAQDIYLQKYSLNKQEMWSDTCKRVVEAVCGQYLDNETKEAIYKIMVERKFIPGGRYLYSSGRPFHQVNNCFLFRAEDSREGWADAMQKATSALMTGGGIGFDYSKLREEGALIGRTGGFSTGPIAHMNMINEAGRYIMQGGARRSAIWAGLNWKHPDVFKFMKVKDWSEDMRRLKEANFSFPLPMEGTNISVIYNTEFFVAMEDKKNKLHKHAKRVWEENCRQAFSTAEPGMSFDFLKDNESLRNAPVSADTKVLTDSGYKTVRSIVNKKAKVWTGKQWASTVFKKTKENADLVKVVLSNGRSIVCDPEHPFIAKHYKGAGKRKKTTLERIAAKDLNTDQKIESTLPLTPKIEQEHLNEFAYSLGFVQGDGSIKDGRGDISYFVEDKKECFDVCVSALNANIGTSGNRAFFKTLWADKEMCFVGNIDSREFIAGWFDADGCYTRRLLRLSCSNKEQLFKLQESLDGLGIKSVVRQDGESGYKPGNKMYTLQVLADSLVRFKQTIPTLRIQIDVSDDWKPYRESEIRVVDVEELDYKEDVYCCDVGVEEHSFMAEGVIISNCTEVTSEDDSDKCNLGTVWLNRIVSRDELAHVTSLATRFLLCGGLYSHVPTEGIREVGLRNNRIGLGLGGFHEWLMSRGEPYRVTPELHKWLNVYEQESDSAAYIGAKELGVSVPLGKRAIAPTGTIGILAETTTGIEPLFCKAYKRRYLDGKTWKHQFVVDGAVKRLLDSGVKLEHIQDSYDISFKERVKFQADVQNYVDMSISSTCNLPAWGSEENNETTLASNSKMLLKYAKRLRGFTCYPDGSRGGQPLTRVSLEEAMHQEGKVFEEKEHECVGGVCGV